jgi:hypothetical protein
MRREHTDRAQVRVPLDVLERALRKARIEYVRLAQLQGTDPGEEGESWAEFELNVEPHEGGPIRVFFPADDESRRVEHRGSTPRSSLPRSSAHAGAVHHTVMVTFDINVQGRRRVLERKARTLGGRGRRGIPPVAPRAPGPDDLGRAAETALTITLRVRLGGRKHCRQIRGLQPRHVLTAEGLDAGGTLLHSCGLRKAGAFFPVARSGVPSAHFPQIFRVRFSYPQHRSAIAPAREKKPERSSPGGARYERERQRTGRDDRLAADR